MKLRKKSSGAAKRNAVFVAVLVVVSVGMVVGVGTASAAPQGVDSCRTIDSPGTYELTRDITDSSGVKGACIKITTSDVVFDGGGHTIDGRHSGSGVAVTGTSSTSLTNVVVKNAVITDWADGVVYRAVTGGTVTGTTLRSNLGGVLLDDADDVALTGNTVTENVYDGITLEGSNDNRLADNTVTANRQNGISLFESRRNEIRHNVVSNTDDGSLDGIGVQLVSSGDNRLVDNTVTNSGEDGISLYSSNGNELHGNDVTDNTDDGLFVYSSSGNTLTRTTAVGNGNDGVEIRFGGSNTLAESRVQDNPDGIELVATRANTLLENVVRENANAGIRLDGNAADNRIYDNHLENADNVAFAGTFDGTANTWNVPQRSGSNVIGGSVVAGNYYATPDGTGFSQTCADDDNDGVCDRPNAHRGAANTDGAPLAPNTVTIVGSGSVSTYEFSVDGDLAKSTRNGGSINSNDEVSGSSATGSVGGSGRDTYEFTGAITRFALDGDATLLVNGKRVDPTTFGSTLTFEAANGKATYEFTTSGSVEKSSAYGGTIQSNDVVSADGSSASGRVAGTGRDSYTYTGDVTDIRVDGPVNLLLDGERTDIEAFLPNTLTVEGTGSGTSYTFTTNGELAKTTRYGGTIQPNDEVSDSSAGGRVVTGRDSYAFSREITDVRANGDARFYLDGERVDPTHPNVVTIVGSGSGSTYEFGVDGTIEKSTRNGATIQPNDEVSPDGSSASGRVVSGADSYVYSGPITALDVRGDATVLVNGEPVDSTRYP